MKLQLSQRSLIIVSFAAIYFIWGSTYLFNYFAIQDIPPFLMAGSRFLVAGAILYAITWSRGAAHPTRGQWGGAARMGFLFLTLGTGGTVWAEQWVDTGIAALIIAFQPLMVVFMLWVLFAKRPSLMILAGVALGVAGMVLLVGQQRFVTDRDTMIGMLVILGSMTSWCYGSVTLNKANLPENRLQSSAIQMIMGGGILLVLALISGDGQRFDPALLTWKAGLSWLFLVVFGSLVAFSAFTYLLQHVSPDKVATSNYVNPVVALFLGWAFNDELITQQSILAALLMLAGVFFINSRLQVKGKPPMEGKPRRLARRRKAVRAVG